MSAKAARMEDTQTQTIEVMGIPPELGRDRDRQRSGSQKPPAADADADADADEDEDMDTAPPEDLGLEEMYGFGNPWPLCPFAVQLTQPIATLLVGPTKTPFHVPEQTLIQLPFFLAALQGRWLESTTKTITMPDDDPSLVAALIEVLTHGSYTPPSPHPAGADPQALLAAKLYHAHVFVLGEKYGSDALCAIAGEFIRALPLVGRECVLRYMVAVYEMCGMESRLRLTSRTGPHCWGGEKTRRLLAGVWRGDGGGRWASRKEGVLGEVCRVCPELARDLLALVCAGDE